MADDQRRDLDLLTGQVIRRGAAEQDALQDGAARARAPGRPSRGPARSGTGRGSGGAPRTRGPTTFITGSPTVSANSSGVKATAQAGIAWSRTGISTIVPASRSGAAAATSSEMLAPREVPPTTARSSSRWSSSAIDLLGELGDRVAPHLPRPVGGAVAQRVEGDHLVAALGQASGQRRLHLLREQQPGSEDGRRSLAMDRVRQALPAVAEVRHAARGYRASSATAGRPSRRPRTTFGQCVQKRRPTTKEILP